MNMLPFVLLAFAFPALVQLARDRIGFLSRLNPLLASYAAGILLGNTVLRGGAAFAAFDLVSTLTVAFSIPLMLFTLDVRSWGRSTGKVMLGMALASVSIVLTVALGSVLFSALVPEYPNLAGLLVGVYTGGTPNLAALRIALGVDNDLYLAVHAADVVVGALYIFFFITVAKRVLGWFLVVPTLVVPTLVVPTLTASAPGSLPETASAAERELVDSVMHKRFPFILDVFRSYPRLPLAGNAGLAALVIGAAFGLSFLVPAEFRTMAVILGITTLAIGASFIKPVRQARGSFEVGEYLILSFSFAAGAMGDISRILGASPMVFLLVAYAVVGSMVLHVILSRLFRLDRDTMMISSTAAICSPPFVGLVANVLGDRRLIAPGITAGIVGYAVGNYLGVIVSRLVALL